jgi:hypothetical protein
MLSGQLDNFTFYVTSWILFETQYI